MHTENPGSDDLFEVVVQRGRPATARPLNGFSQGARVGVAMGLLETGHAAAEIAELRMRTRRVRGELEGQIRAEGGEVLSVRSLNSRLILHSPFPSKLIRISTIGGRPVLLQMRARYPRDSGSWFIFAPNGMPVQWAWKSDHRRGELPVARENARVHNEVVALPLWASGLVYVALVAAVMFLVVYLGSRR